MFAVIFEVQPKRERWDDYLALAKQLKPKLEAIDGFIDNERFASERTEGRLLSLSTWRDEKSVVRWRSQGEHHGVQEQGRNRIFEDYHLRVGEVTADTAPPAGHTVREQRLDETEIGAAKLCTITEIPADAALATDQALRRLGLDAQAAGLLDHEIFESITNPGKLLILGSWRDAAAARDWQRAPAGGAAIRHRSVRVIRDYGLNDRREAPQFYPAVAR
jgi:heme-degrading monooxygenase HmoA